MALKDLEIKYAARRSRDYKLFDGEGLYVLVRPGGSKLWRFKYAFNGKEKTLSFGKYPAISGAAARQMRSDAKVLLAKGIDPGEEKKSKKRIQQPLELFEPVARAWHANRAAELDEAHAARVLRRMERDVFPALGQRDIKSITAPEVLEIVRAVEARGALDISRRVKQGIGQVFRFAIASGWATNDPTISLNDALTRRDIGIDGDEANPFVDRANAVLGELLPDESRRAIVARSQHLEYLFLTRMVVGNRERHQLL